MKGSSPTQEEVTPGQQSWISLLTLDYYQTLFDVSTKQVPSSIYIYISMVVMTTTVGSSEDRCWYDTILPDTSRHSRDEP